MFVSNNRYYCDHIIILIHLFKANIGFHLVTMNSPPCLLSTPPLPLISRDQREWEADKERNTVLPDENPMFASKWSLTTIVHVMPTR